MKYYFKATRDGGVSGHDSNYIHREGINHHPNPDTSDVECGAGVHLAMSIEAALSYVSRATELYLARPIGKIYGRGDDKVRVGAYRLWRVPNDLWKAYQETTATAEKAYQEATATALKALREETLARAGDKKGE